MWLKAPQILSLKKKMTFCKWTFIVDVWKSSQKFEIRMIWHHQAYQLQTASTSSYGYLVGFCISRLLHKVSVLDHAGIENLEELPTWQDNIKYGWPTVKQLKTRQGKHIAIGLVVGVRSSTSTYWKPRFAHLILTLHWFPRCKELFWRPLGIDQVEVVQNHIFLQSPESRDVFVLNKKDPYGWVGRPKLFAKDGTSRYQKAGAQNP